MRAQLNFAIDDKIEYAIILGSGLGDFVKHVKIISSVDFVNIPHFVHLTVSFHVGKLTLGEIEGRKIIILQGRSHLYEGYTAKEVSYPVRILKGERFYTFVIN